MTTPENVSSDEKPWFSKMRLILRPRSGIGRLLVAATVGATVGIGWAILLAILSGSSYEATRHLICFPLGLGITAIVIFSLRYLPEVVGLASGFLTMFTAALIVGPHDFFMGIWIIVYGGARIG